jgi:glycosyltransferase involved in cell wall biosynthesis
MAPVELAAAGRPTIAYRAGGATETIIDGVTGVFFDHQATADVIEAIERFEHSAWPVEVLRSHAEGFGSDVFKAQFRDFLARVGAPITDDTEARPPSAVRTHAFVPAIAGLRRGATV